jgi:short-subunit dehydrogenase
MQQYAMTKLFVTAFTARLAAEVDPEEVIVNCSNPAATRTAFFREVGGLLKLVVGVLGYIIGRSGADAARIYVHSSLVLGKESHGAFVDWAVRP